MPESSPVVSGRFPDGVVEIGRAFAESAVKLGGDEARLALHESSIVLPSLEKGLLVRFIQRDHIHQHDGAGLDCDLTFEREGGVERAQQRHVGAPFLLGCMMSIWYDAMSHIDILMSI